jgi:hypothetical protein
VKKGDGPKTKIVEARLVQEFDGVALMIGDYYICTLKNDGTLYLHRDVHLDCIATADEGRIFVNKEA